MGHKKKCQHKHHSVSIIASDVDQHFSPTEESDSSTNSKGSHTDSSNSASSINIPKKRHRSYKKPISANATATPESTQASMKISYIIQAFSALEMKKPASKHIAKNSSLQLSPDEPWDTV